MDEIFFRTWHDMLSRVDGPFHFRFVIQPIMALFVATRSGLRDAREDRPAFLFGIVRNTKYRRHFLAHAWRDIGRLFIMAGVMDIAFQLVAFKTVRPLETLFIAVALSIVPYSLWRGPVNRLAQKFGKHSGDDSADTTRPEEVSR